MPGLVRELRVLYREYENMGHTLLAMAGAWRHRGAGSSTAHALLPSDDAMERMMRDMERQYNQLAAIVERLRQLGQPVGPGLWEVLPPKKFLRRLRDRRQ